jgi:tetratricopeptide (TPR) repeat protein
MYLGLDMFDFQIKRLNLCTLLGVSLFSTYALADFDDVLAKECPKIKNYIAKGGDFYQQKNYPKAREQFKLQAGWGETCRLADSEIATAYNNVALTYLNEKQYLKAKAWLRLMPEDKKSIFNLSVNNSKINAAQQVANQSITGEYWRYSGAGIWDSIIVEQIKDQYKIHFDGYRVNQMTMYWGPNMGMFEVILPVDNNLAKFDQRLFEDNYGGCVFDFEFSLGQIKVTEEMIGTCGFGMGVYAGGTYVKVSE